MVKLNRIYTKTGDDGSTGLADGSRRSKADLRLESYGTVDELNSVLGLAVDCLREAHPVLAGQLAKVQNDLFDLGADLATPGRGDGLRILAAQTDRLEALIDEYNADLPALESFVLPGGSTGSGWLHLARTTCRRAERLTVALKAVEEINEETVKYLNRLSDLLFVLARVVNDGGAGDVLWVPGENQS